MQIAKNVIYIIFLGLISVSFQCHRFYGEDFSWVPAISFSGIQSITKWKGQGVDSILISINFQDGDGNLGILSVERNEVLPPSPPSKFQEFFYITDNQGNIIDKKTNPFYYNYFVTVYKKIGNSFELIDFPDAALGFNGAFEPLWNNDINKQPKLQPLKGTISKILTIYQSNLFKSNEVIKCRIKIVDRDLNFSNEIETSEIKISTN